MIIRNKDLDDENFQVKRRRRRVEIQDYMNEVKGMLKKNPKVKQYIKDYLSIINSTIGNLTKDQANDMVIFIMNMEFNDMQNNA